MGYFGEVLKGYIPLNRPLILQRVIMNGMPDVEEDREYGEEDEDSGDEKLSPGEGDEVKKNK